eukprot:COSAG04_NODE_288_length_17855_cov_32.496621_3_plen_243_part_00
MTIDVCAFVGVDIKALTLEIEQLGRPSACRLVVYKAPRIALIRKIVLRQRVAFVDARSLRRARCKRVLAERRCGVPVPRSVTVDILVQYCDLGVFDTGDHIAVVSLLQLAARCAPRVRCGDVAVGRRLVAPRWPCGLIACRRRVHHIDHVGRRCLGCCILGLCGQRHQRKSGCAHPHAPQIVTCLSLPQMPAGVPAVPAVLAPASAYDSLVFSRWRRLRPQPPGCRLCSDRPLELSCCEGAG